MLLQLILSTSHFLGIEVEFLLFQLGIKSQFKQFKQNKTKQTKEKKRMSSNNKHNIQTYTDKLNNSILIFSNIIREIKFQHRQGQLIKRRRMLQKRNNINHAKAFHQRKKQIQIETNKNAIKEFLHI